MPSFAEIPFSKMPFISQYFTDEFKGVEHLLPAEALIVEQAAEKRRRDFSTGRYCARQVLDQLIDQQPEILQGKGREPMWPDGVVGSISHSDKLAGAVVALQTNVTAIGLDIETIGGVKPELWRLLFHDSEQELILSKQSEADTWATLLFSLKEAFYKLQYPLTEKFLDFTDVCISESNGELIYKSVNLNNDIYPVMLKYIKIQWVQVGDQLISICYIN